MGAGVNDSDNREREIAELKAQVARLESAREATPSSPPLTAGKPKRRRLGCLSAVLLIFALLVIVGVAGHGGNTPSASDASASSGSAASAASQEESPEHKANYQAILFDMARIYDSLRDQQGVKWGTMTGARNGTTLCGSVNAHNAFGGYTGLRRFIFNEAVGDPGVPLGGGAYVHWEEHPGFAREWKRLCLGDPNSVTTDGQYLASQVEALAPMAKESGR